MRQFSAIPFPVLTTDRLTLRQLLDHDAAEIFALRSDEAVNKYLGRSPSKSLEDAVNFIHTIQENTRGNNTFYWAITLTGISKVIGTICLFNFSAEEARAEIGFEMAPGYQGRGLMREAVSEVIRFAFKEIGLQSIKAFTHAENHPSVRILASLGFRDRVEDERFFVYTLFNEVSDDATSTGMKI